MRFFLYFTIHDEVVSVVFFFLGPDVIVAQCACAVCVYVWGKNEYE